LSEVQAAARTLGLEVATLNGRSEALYVCPDALINTNRIRINILAVGAQLAAGRRTIVRPLQKPRVVRAFFSEVPETRIVSMK
jgi:hypothetical protein